MKELQELNKRICLLGRKKKKKKRQKCRYFDALYTIVDLDIINKINVYINV